MSSLVIPKQDRVEFGMLREACRKEVQQRLRVMERLLANGRRGIQAVLATEAGRLGCATVTLRKLYDAYRHSHDWRSLIDLRRFPEANFNLGVPTPIVELFKGLCESNQRKCKPAYRELLRMYHRGEPAGLEWPAVHPSTGIPRGCTYRNLLRAAKPSDYELTLARVGRSAASAMLPKVLSTRAGLRVGQMFVCDDQEYDVYVGDIGVNRQLTRPAGFNTLCLASACEILQSYKRIVVNKDGGKQKLRQVDYQWHLVSLLTTIGYREDTGTIIAGEHGTANAGSEFMERVRLATGGHVSFDASGIHGEQVAGLFRGQPRGNPRYKAARESWFNLLRNEMGALPGPTGLDRHHAPEENYGLLKYSRDLLDAITARPDLAEALQFPVLRWPQFVALVDAIVRRINQRTDHELEGWGDRVAQEWRLTLDQNSWLPSSQLLALAAPAREVAHALIQSTPGLWRTRKLAPLEVYEAGRGELTRVEGAMVPVLLGKEAALPVTVTVDHQLVIQDVDIEADPMWFDAELTNGRLLGQRQEVLAYLNPFLPQSLEICDLDGRWLGTAPRAARISKLDTEALQHRYGKVRRLEQKLLAPVAARGAALARERVAMHERNAALLSGEPITAAEKQEARRARANAADPADFTLVEDAAPVPAADIADPSDFC